MKKSAVFILFGQSNAAGHGVPMGEKDIIRTPLRNVFGLSREKNQSFTNEKLYWDNYVSFGMNLAQELDNTYSLANQLARKWQENIDNGIGMKYDDLYIVQIAIGSQGVTKKYMWYPQREQKLVGGVLGKVDISLYPFSKHILSLLDESLTGEEYDIIGVHWRGGEEDANENIEMLKNELFSIYEKMISEWNAILKTPPVILHKLSCRDWMDECDPSGGRRKNMEYINSVFENLKNKFSNVSVFDVRNYPGYINNVRGNRLFIEDAVHYTAEVNAWVADCVVRNCE